MNILRLTFVFICFAYQCEVEAFSQFFSKWFGGEYCGKEWISFSFYDFQTDLEENLFGQPLVTESVGYALKSHFEAGDRSKKALVLSFHGMQGTGKNFVSELIVKNIFKKHREGSKSDFVHFFNGRLEFPREQLRLEYQYLLESRIKGALEKCPDSVFIFDEVDKMVRGVLDILKPYLDYRYEVQGVNPRRAVFIFLSNIGQRPILEKYLDYWSAGVDRDSLTLNDFDSVILSGAFNEDGGLQFSDNIESNLIDHYIPFLPLEKSHIRQCIMKEIDNRCKREGISRWSLNETQIIEEVFKTLTFGPKPEKLFSANGVKRIHQQVATAMTRSRWRSRSEL